MLPIASYVSRNVTLDLGIRNSYGSVKMSEVKIGPTNTAVLRLGHVSSTEGEVIVTFAHVVGREFPGRTG